MNQPNLQADLEARHRIRSGLYRTLFVEAGAGTGKTAVLVDRYLALVLAGGDVERIVAITFTERAAAELKDRVRLELETRLNGDETTPAQHQHIEAALATLDRAPISTIHAFCQAVLRSFAVRAGIDPAFEIEETVVADRRFEESWRAYLDALGSDATAEAAIGRLLDLGLRSGDLQTLAKSLWQAGDLADQLRETPLTAPPPEWPDFSMLREELRSIGMPHVPENDRLRSRIEETIAHLDDLMENQTEQESHLASIVPTLNPKTGGLGNKPNWKGSTDLKQARETTSQVLEALIELLAGLRSHALSQALPYVVQFVTGERQARNREGRLVFDDLILGVRDVLRDDASARLALQRRYDTVLLDEFQDTDPLQAEIALAFAGVVDDGTPRPGSLFLVGDPKQSIYRFRRADMSIYARVGDQIEAANGELIELSLNRRSQTGVIEWVNTVFQKVIGPGLDLTVQPPYKPLHAVRDDTLHGPSVAWFGHAVEGTPAGRIRDMEARHLAAYCHAVVADGWQVAPRGEPARPARYGDIAVLLPARTVLQTLERALSAAGVPYRVEGGSLVYATQEVRDVINCLTAIDDPADDVAVVAALRSAAYACSDVELLRFRSGGGSFNYLAPGLDGVEGRVANGLRDLRQWHGRRAGMDLAALVERYIAERRLVEIGLLDSGHRNAFRRARFLVEQARSFESAGRESLRAFIEWLEHRAGDAILDSEAAGLDDDEDAVRILTVHASKGLEFPIVFLTGLGVGPPYTSFVFGQTRRDGRAAVSIGTLSRNNRFTLGSYDEVREQEERHADAERARLLYVAATRARDHLVLSLFHKEGTDNCPAFRLLQAGAREASQPMPPIDLSPSTQNHPFRGIEIDLPDADEASFTAARAALVQTARTQRHISATGLMSIDDAARGFEVKDEREDDTEPWSRGRAGTHLGRAVHAALQTLPWNADDATIEAVARAQAVAEAVPDRAEEAASLIRYALGSEVAQRARTARRALREVPFALTNDGTLLEGYADLIIEAEDGSIEVVDWKTDHVAPTAVPDRLAHYALQAGIYVLGLETATGRKVTRVTYVFVSAGVAASPGEPAALATMASQRLQALQPV